MGMKCAYLLEELEAISKQTRRSDIITPNGILEWNPN